MLVKVALFVTCLADSLYPEVGRSTVAVLERLGVEVVFPREQTCCGQLHRNAGYAPGAALERRFDEVFAAHDAIVTPSGSCAAHVRAHGGASGARERELSEFLVGQLGAVDVGATVRGRAHLPPHLPLDAIPRPR